MSVYNGVLDFAHTAYAIAQQHGNRRWSTPAWTTLAMS